MKRLFYFMSVAVLLWSCGEDQEEILQGGNDVETEVIIPSIFDLPETIYGSTADDQSGAESRTYLEDKRVLWHSGDAISYFAGNTHNAKYLYNGEGGESSVEFAKDAEIGGTTGSVLLKSQAVYPYNENVTVVYEGGIDKIHLTYPTTQKYGVNSFGRDANIMVAAGDNNQDDDLHFRNAVGYLVIKLYGTSTNGQPTTVKSITLSSVSGIDKIAGSAVIVADKDKAPVITIADDASTSVTMDCSNDVAGVTLGEDAEHATEFWFCLPPVTFTDGIKITVTDVYDNSYTKQTANTVNIVRNEVQPMAALEFESNAPAATKLWYTRSDGEQTPLEFYDDKENPFNAPITQHSWDPSVGKIVIEFGAPLDTIQVEAFRDTEIATIVMPEGVTTIEEGAFENSDLREITIPGSMTSIGVNAFYNCERLESVTFLPSPTKTPLNICNMDYTQVWGPFYDTKLTTINLNRKLNYVDEDGDKFTADDDDEGIFYHKNYSNVGEVNVTLGSQVDTIWYKMFNHLPIRTLTIPGTVKTIENNVFEGCSALTTLNFEPSVDGAPLTIGYYGGSSDDDSPFYDSPLTTVNLNRELVYTFNNPNEIDEGIFSNKSTLVNLTLGEQVKTLSPYMFAGSGFTTLDLNKVETINNHALANTPLTSLTVPGNVNTIGNNVFEGCTQLADLTFEPSTTETPLTMGFYDGSGDAGPFYDAPLATLDLNREISYTFGGSTIDDKSEGLFGNKSTLTTVTLGEQVKTLSNHMFAKAAFTELVIPGSVNTIGNNVFEGCEQLATITFEPSANETPLTMGFYDASGDVGPFYDAPLATLNLDRDIVYTFGGSTIDDKSEGLFGNKTTLTTVTLGEQVKTFSSHMFANAAFTELVVPGSLTLIENDAFYNCKKLQSITFNPSPTNEVLTMGYDTYDDDENLFQDNDALTTLVLDREIKQTMTGIDHDVEGLFGGMPKLTNVTLGEQVKTLTPHMFAGSGITSIDLNKVETISNSALARNAMTSLTIPGYVNTIGNNVFQGCSQLATLTFEPSTDETPLTMGFYDVADDDGPFYDSPLTTLNLNREIIYTFGGYDISSDNEGLFGGKKNLKNVTLGDQVKTLSKRMFAGAGFTSINLNKVETINDYALTKTAITALIIPGYAATIGNNVFEGCTSLTSLKFEPSPSDTPLTIGFQPGSNQRGPFFQSPLTNIVVHRNLKMTDAYESACDDDDEGIFSTAHDILPTTVTLGGQISELPKYVFAGLDIESISIPQVVNKINGWAFYNCKKLSSVRFESGTAPLTIGAQIGSSDSGPFWQSPLSNIYINRELVMDEKYAKECDQSDEGVFSNEYYDDDELPVTNLIIGNNMKTILPYMFASTRIQQLHLPESIDKVCKNVIEDNEVINAIIFYDNVVRPEVEDGAFGKVTYEIGGIVDADGNPPGDWQYFIFVPKGRGGLHSNDTDLYFTVDDLMAENYWDEIHRIMVEYNGAHPNCPLTIDGRTYESRYLDVAGYEWYRDRYYNNVMITPPTE